jgi:hypothetical protein
MVMSSTLQGLDISMVQQGSSSSAQGHTIPV